MFYVNDFEVDSFNAVKYADNTTFYKPVKSHQKKRIIVPAMEATQSWAARTEIMNVFLDYRKHYDDEVLVNNLIVKPNSSLSL